MVIVIKSLNILVFVLNTWNSLTKLRNLFQLFQELTSCVPSPSNATNRLYFDVQFVLVHEKGPFSKKQTSKGNFWWSLTLTSSFVWIRFTVRPYRQAVKCGWTSDLEVWIRTWNLFSTYFSFVLWLIDTLFNRCYWGILPFVLFLYTAMSLLKK